MYTNATVRELQKTAAALRHMVVDLVHAAGASHLGGPLSSCDVLTALYFHFMNFGPENRQDPERDRLVLSKGHAGDILYCILARKGFYTWDELLEEFKKNKGRWGEHPNRLHNPGIEVSTGSLGHGLPLSLGMATAARLDGSSRHIYCLVGDGELQEGSNWESIMYAGHHQSANLVLLIDQNQAQGTRLVRELMCDDHLADRIQSFGWDVREIADGNDMGQLCEALGALPACARGGKPVCLLLHTVKGKGISFMEERPADWHAGGFSPQLLEEAHRSIDLALEQSLGHTVFEEKEENA